MPPASPTSLPLQTTTIHLPRGATSFKCDCLFRSWFDQVRRQGGTPAELDDALDHRSRGHAACARRRQKGAARRHSHLSADPQVRAMTIRTNQPLTRSSCVSTREYRRGSNAVHSRSVARPFSHALSATPRVHVYAWRTRSVCRSRDTLLASHLCCRTRHKHSSFAGFAFKFSGFVALALRSVQRLAAQPLADLRARGCAHTRPRGGAGARGAPAQTAARCQTRRGAARGSARS